MQENLSVTKWIDHLDKEYLSTFIRQGGATVKFVVPDEAVKPSLKQSLKARAGDSGYLVIDIDSVDCRFHMPQDIFFALASQVNWRLITRRFILRVAEGLNYRVDGINAEDANNITASIANVNDLDPAMVSLALRPEFESRVYKNPAMAKDFRVAMSHLSIQESNPAHESDPAYENDPANHYYSGQPIIDWLTGADTRITNVRPFSIYTPINRTTARIFLESALHWFHKVGIPGTLIMLDNTRVTTTTRPTDESRYYTRPMAMEHYELLRQFIDNAERLTATMLLTISNNDFLDTESDRKSRGIGMYQALQTRIMDDVKGRDLVNPNASLIRLS